MLALLLAAAALPSCVTHQLNVSTDARQGDFNGMSHSGTLLIFRNKSRRTCTLPGLPALTFLDATGKTLPIQRRAPIGMHPGPVVLPVRLAPGKVVSTPLRWVSGPVYDHSRCPFVVSVTVAGWHVPLGAKMCGQAGQPIWIDQPTLRPGTSTSG
jgi:hypothetical protein